MRVNPAQRSPKQPVQRGIPRHLIAIENWCEQPRVARRLRADLPRWNQLHSALDALHQTHTAVETYNRSNEELNEGQRLLSIYGLLQALVVQQDALCHLAESLQTRPVRLRRHRRLEEIRNIRNWTVGHPTKADRNFIQSHHAIRRPQVGRGGFALFSAFDDGRNQYTYVPLPQLARLQRRVISALLREMIAELRQRDERPPVVRTLPRVQQAAPRVAPVASRWKHEPPVTNTSSSPGRVPVMSPARGANSIGSPERRGAFTSNRNGELQRRQPTVPRQPANIGQQRGTDTSRMGVAANNAPQVNRGPGRNQPHANGKRNGKHNRRPHFGPEPRTWMEKVNPPPLLPARRAARLAAQAIQ